MGSYGLKEPWGEVCWDGSSPSGARVAGEIRSPQAREGVKESASLCHPERSGRLWAAERRVPIVP